MKGIGFEIDWKKRRSTLSVKSMSRPEKALGTSSVPASENRAYSTFLTDKGQLAERVKEDSCNSCKQGDTLTFQ